MKVLGCDPSLTDFGWVIMNSEDNQIEASGRIRTSSDDLYIKRYLKHKESLKEIVSQHDPDYVGIEKPPPNSSWSAGLYPIWMYSSEVFFKNRIPFCILMPPTLKAFAREVLDDSGKMFKQDMIEAAEKLMDGYGNGKLNHNVADAYLEAYYASRFKRVLDGDLDEDDLSKKEQKTFTKTVKRRKTGRIDKVGMVYNEGEKHFAFDDPKYDELYEEQKTIFD
jgi:hypothetical protein